MKKGFKKRLLIGIVTVTLVAPLILNGAGMNHVHADQTAVASQVTTNSNNQLSNNSGELATLKAQIQALNGSMQITTQKAQKEYNNIPKKDKSEQKAFLAQYNKQQGPAEQRLIALQRQYINTMTPAQRKQAQQKQQAAQKQYLQQIQKQMKSQQKKEQAKMLKTAQTIFVIQGKRVYTLRTDIVKGNNGQEQLQQIPGINKKYYSSLRAFSKKATAKIQKARITAYNAMRTRNKATRKKLLKKAQSLYMKYARIARIPTKKQQEAETKKITNQQKKGHFRVTNHKHYRRIKQNSRKHKHIHKSTRKKDLRKKRNRIKRSRYGIRRNKRTRRHAKNLVLNN